MADDDPAIRGFLTHTLNGVGYHALPAMDVREAMNHLLAPGVVAAVLDLLFVDSAGHSGLDLLRFIRHDVVLANLPVIVLTGGRPDRALAAEVEALHAELWHKPVDPIELVHRLDSCKGMNAGMWSDVECRSFGAC